MKLIQNKQTNRWFYPLRLPLVFAIIVTKVPHTLPNVASREPSLNAKIVCKEFMLWAYQWPTIVWSISRCTLVGIYAVSFWHVAKKTIKLITNSNILHFYESNVIINLATFRESSMEPQTFNEDFSDAACSIGKHILFFCFLIIKRTNTQMHKRMERNNLKHSGKSCCF